MLIIATAHGNSLESLIKKPYAIRFSGRYPPCNISDDEAKTTFFSQKTTVFVREKQPTF